MLQHHHTTVGLISEQELFTKLRFSYVEQMTKEQFLRSITDNPPQLVEAAENDAKETEILALKAELKERKQGVAQLQKQLVEKGAELARRYEGVQLRTTQLESLPVEIEKLEQSIARLQQDHAPQSDNPELALPLAETTRLLQERQAESALLDAQIAKLKAQLPGRARELEKLERELKPLETQKQATVAAAKEAQRRREEGGGIGDKLEERGRWLRASEQALKDMLEVKEG